MGLDPQTAKAAAFRAGAAQRTGSDVEELLGRVRRLELAARRNAGGLLAGDWQTTFVGDGLEFHEARKYVEGESVRRIDWNLTARLDEPHVRVDREERQREVFLAVDVSPSMHSGFTGRTKLETAIELAATLAVSAIEAGDRVGLALFADELLAEQPPRGGRKHLFALLRCLLDHTGPWTREVEVSDPRLAIHAIERRRGHRFVVFLISDFLDHDVPDDLRHLRARHDVSLLHVYDPFEHAAASDDSSGTESPYRPRFTGFASEGTAQARAAAAVTGPGAGGSLDDARAFLRKHAAALRIDTASFSTADPVALGLGRFLHRKRSRRR